MLALALGHSPELLVLDDPTLGLDAVARRSLFEEIVGELADRGTSVFLTTHDLAGFEGIATHVGILKDGKLAVDEDAEALKSRFRRIRYSNRLTETRTAFGTELDEFDALRVKVRGWGIDAIVSNFDEEAFERFRATDGVDDATAEAAAARGDLPGRRGRGEGRRGKRRPSVKEFLAVARRDVRERRFVFAAAAFASLIPFVMPLFRGWIGGSAPEVRSWIATAARRRVCAGARRRPGHVDARPVDGQPAHRVRSRAAGVEPGPLERPPRRRFPHCRPDRGDHRGPGLARRRADPLERHPRRGPTSPPGRGPRGRRLSDPRRRRPCGERDAAFPLGAHRARRGSGSGGGSRPRREPLAFADLLRGRGPGARDLGIRARGRTRACSPPASPLSHGAGRTSGPLTGRFRQRSGRRSRSGSSE